MIRLAVLVSGRGSNLRAIASAIDEGRCQAHIASVISDKPGAEALDFARERDIPAAVVPLAKGACRDAWNQALTEAVACSTPDLVVLAGFMRVVGASFLDAFGDRTINIHPSLLPAFPGAHGPRDALAAGVRVTGCTVHRVDAGVDTGKILAQAAVPVDSRDTAASLHARIQAAEHLLLPAVVDAIARGRLNLDSANTTEADPALALEQALFSPHLLWASISPDGAQSS